MAKKVYAAERADKVYKKLVLGGHKSLAKCEGSWEKLQIEDAINEHHKQEDAWQRVTAKRKPIPGEKVLVKGFLTTRFGAWKDDKKGIGFVVWQSKDWSSNKDGEQYGYKGITHFKRVK